MGYVMQLVPQWQKTFKENKALEHLDITDNSIVADYESMTIRIEQQDKEIQRLRSELADRTISKEDEKSILDLLQKYREGKVKIEP